MTIPRIESREQFRAVVKAVARRMPRRSETEAVVYLIDRVERHQRTVTDLAEHAHLDRVITAWGSEVGPAMDRDLGRR